MEAWVIKRNDGKYLSRYYKVDARNKPMCEICFTENLLASRMFTEEDIARLTRVDWQICKVVRIEVKEVKNG